MSNYRNGEIDRYSRMFAALSNHNRAEIFLRLASCCGEGRQECSSDEAQTCVGDLGRNLEIAASTVSHHIKELHRAGLIKMERVGRTVLCCVDARAVDDLADFLAAAVPQKRLISKNLRNRRSLKENKHE